MKQTHQFSLLIWSPYPGVSTMLRRRRTPFSEMTREREKRRVNMNSPTMCRLRLTMRNGVNVRRLPNRLIRLQTTLRVNKMRSKDRVNQRRLSKSRLACPPQQNLYTKSSKFHGGAEGVIQRVSGVINQYYRIRKTDRRR
jgi:hypothetical protein